MLDADVDLDDEGELVLDSLLDEGELVLDPLLDELLPIELDDDELAGSALLSLYIADDAAPDAVSRSRQPVSVTLRDELLRDCELDGVVVCVCPWLLCASRPTSAHAVAIETAVIIRFI
jgi:hypothetical protein